MNPRLFPFLLAFVLLIAVTMLQWHSFRQMTVYTGYVDQTQRIITSLAQLSNYLKSAQIYSPSAARSTKRAYYQLCKQEANLVYARLNELDTLVADNLSQRARLLRARRLIDHNWASLMENNIAELIQRNETWRLDELYQIQRLLNEGIAYQNRQLAGRRTELNDMTGLVRRATIGLSALAITIIVAALLVQIVLSRRQQQLENLLASVLASSQDGIVAYRAIWHQDRVVDFQIRFANASIGTLLRIDPNEVTGRRLTEMDSYVMKSDLFEKYCRAVQTGQPSTFETFYRRGDYQRWFMVQLAKWEDGITATFHDINDLKQYEDQLKVTIRQLSESNQELQQFTYIASHDLQEPLRKIQTFGSLLQQEFGSRLGPQGEDIINRMESAAMRMSTLIKDLLDYSRLTTRQLAFGPQDLNVLVGHVLTMLEVVIREKKAHIEVGLLPTVPGDETQLWQLFQNLISNALKFTQTDAAGVPVPPVIQISSRLIKRTDLPADFATLDTCETYCQVSVADNGIGFEAHQVERIFGTFQRLHNKKDYPGTGIGLAIVKKVVDNHHGYVTAHSQPGKGSTFSLYLPCPLGAVPD